MSSRKSLSYCFGGAIALVVMFAAPPGHADTIRYRYVALDQVPLPAPYSVFSPSVVVDGRVFGTAFDSTFTNVNVAVYDRGTIKIGPAGTASVANRSGIIGGADPSSEAALFTGGVTSLVPRLPGEAFANVVGLTDKNLSLVQSTDASFATTYAYFRAGTESAINFGLPDPVFGAFLNEDGLIGITKQESPTDHFLHGFRYDPRTATSAPLPPFAGDLTDVNVLVQGINAHGEVLGYSFTDFSSPAYHERIGVWNKARVFHPYFYETIVTNVLVFNDEDQIVITNGFFSPGNGHSYFVPESGTRLDLATLVRNVPAGLLLVNVVSIDNEGNMVGFASDASFTNSYPFLLQPLAHGEAEPGETKVRGFKMPKAIEQDFDRRHPHK